MVSSERGSEWSAVNRAGNGSSEQNRVVSIEQGRKWEWSAVNRAGNGQQ